MVFECFPIFANLKKYALISSRIMLTKGATADVTALRVHASLQVPFPRRRVEYAQGVVELGPIEACTNKFHIIYMERKSGYYYADVDLLFDRTESATKKLKIAKT